METLANRTKQNLEKAKKQMEEYDLLVAEEEKTGTNNELCKMSVLSTARNRLMQIIDEITKEEKKTHDKGNAKKLG